MNAEQRSARSAPEAAGEEEISRIIVGVDGSKSSLAALRRAVRFARSFDASLEAITAWSFPISYAPMPVSWYPDKDAEQIIKNASDSVLGEDWPSFFSTSVREGDPARVLIEASKDADLLVLGSRGHGGFAGLLLGSVSAQCAEHADCPVLILHGHHQEETGTKKSDAGRKR